MSWLWTCGLVVPGSCCEVAFEASASLPFIGCCRWTVVEDGLVFIFLLPLVSSSCKSLQLLVLHAFLAFSIQNDSLVRV
jgi:hypothetical protein